jgi:hypothetical protein
MTFSPIGLPTIDRPLSLLIEQVEKFHNSATDKSLGTGRFQNGIHFRDTLHF